MIVVRWLGPVVVVLGWSALVGSFWVTTQLLLRDRPAEQPWWERGARNYELVMAINVNMIAAWIGAAFLASTVVGPVAAVSSLTLWRIGLVAMTAAGVEWLAATERRLVTTSPEIHQDNPRRLTPHLLNLPLYGLSGAFVLAPSPNPAANIEVLVLWAAALVVITLRWAAVGRVLRVVTPGPDLLDEVAKRLNCERPVLGQLHIASANTVATLDRRVLFTTGILAHADVDELTALGRNALGRIESRHLHLTGNLLPLIAATLGLPLVASAAATSENPVARVALLVAIFAGVFGINGLQRHLTRHADRHEPDPRFAPALEKVHRINGLPATHRFNTHPALYDRMAATDTEPAYPRPAPPRRTPALLGLLAPAAITAVLVTGLSSATPIIPNNLRPYYNLAIGDPDHVAASAEITADALIDGNAHTPAAILDSGLLKTTEDINEFNDIVVDRLATAAPVTCPTDQLNELSPWAQKAIRTMFYNAWWHSLEITTC
ncbi:MAG: hypothetical protein GY701_10055 [Sulfitobacter sp.]|nr:hypothetical protein [Sulfitobacter sp.]